MAEEVDPYALIQGLQRDDPRLWQALTYIFDNIDKINNTLFPDDAEFGAEEVHIVPSDPSNLQFAFFPQAIGFSWNFADNALQYEMRVGNTWDTADFVLRTTSLTALIPPRIVGEYKFFLKSISISGEYSPGFQTVTVVVDGPSGVNPSVDVVDNNVLLDWDDAISEFQIAHYIITRTVLSTNSYQMVGNVLGTFTTLFETLAGTYAYGVIPVDIAGNQGPETKVAAEVRQPPDFVLQNSFISQWTGSPKGLVYVYD